MLNVYAVYDSCSGIFGDPFIAVNDAVAKRMFVNSLSNPSIPQYIRDDAVLYGLTLYDNESGYFSSDAHPYVVTRGSTVVVPDVSHEKTCDPYLDSDYNDLPEVSKHAE